MKWLIGLSLLAALLTAGVYAQAQYCQICKDHTLCIYPGRGSQCGQYFAGGVSQSEANIIVNTHNALRQRVASGQESRGSPGPQPAATNMKTMEWDAELAQVAQRWVDQCRFGHDACRNVARFGVGQNAYMTMNSGNTAGSDWKGAVEAWYSEVSKFSRNNINPFRFTMDTGHYTQVVWANTYRVGCGYAFFKPNGSQWFSKYYVCNYGPAGNVIGTAMYIVR